MLPAGGDAWSESRRRHALLHEQAHLDRHDAVTALIARMACAMHWFNPLVWLAAAQLRMLQEKACDDAVLRAGVRPSDYAQFLLDLASRRRGEAISPAVLGMIGCSPLQTRIRSILDGDRSRTERARLASFAGLCLMGGASVTLAAIAFVTPTTNGSNTNSLIAADTGAQRHTFKGVPGSDNPIQGEPFASRALHSRLVVPVAMNSSNHGSPDCRAIHPPRPIRQLAPLVPAPAVRAQARAAADPPGTNALPALPSCSGHSSGCSRSSSSRDSCHPAYGRTGARGRCRLQARHC